MRVEHSSTHRLTSSVDIPALLNDPAPPKPRSKHDCAGPHCNGANKAALRLARLGLRVKMMIGGVTGWIDEGFTLRPS